MPRARKAASRASTNVVLPAPEAGAATIIAGGVRRAGLLFDFSFNRSPIRKGDGDGARGGGLGGYGHGEAQHPAEEGPAEAEVDGEIEAFCDGVEIGRA